MPLKNKKKYHGAFGAVNTSISIHLLLAPKTYESVSIFRCRFFMLEMKFPDDFKLSWWKNLGATDILLALKLSRGG